MYFEYLKEPKCIRKKNRNYPISPPFPRNYVAPVPNWTKYSDVCIRGCIAELEVQLANAVLLTSISSHQTSTALTVTRSSIGWRLTAFSHC